MPNLQDIDGADQRPLSHELFNGRFCVSGEQRRESSDPQQSDNGGVVDVGTEERARRIGGVRVPDLERRALVEVDALARARQAVRRPWLGPRQLQEPIVGRVLIGPSRIKDGRHSEPSQDLRKAADMVLVRVGQHNDVDRPPPPRHLRAELTQCLIGIGTGVDEHAATSRRHDQDAVALSHVHDGQMEATVRQRGDRYRSQRGGEYHKQAPRPGERAQESHQASSEFGDGPSKSGLSLRAGKRHEFGN